MIQGELGIGTLLAAIAAHKDLAAPWKELLNYYQRREDARIKFGQVIEQFELAGMLDRDLQLAEPGAIEKLSGELVAANVLLEDDTGTVLVDGATLTLDPTKHVAMIGAGGSGKEELMQLLARLIAPNSGTIAIGGDRLADMPEAVTGRRLGYVGAQPYLFAASVYDNLVYGLKHRPLRAAVYDDEGQADHRTRTAEAEASGNSADDPRADWIDYQAAGADDEDALGRRVVRDAGYRGRGRRHLRDGAPRHHRSGLKGRSGTTPARGARDISRAVGRSRDRGPGRDLRRRRLQRERDVGGEPAIRHPRSAMPFRSTGLPRIPVCCGSSRNRG